MGVLGKLASQTVIYGLSSILGRFLNYLLVPLYTYTFSAAEYGVVSEFYAYAGFFSVVLALGLETGYFRFRREPGYDPAQVYSAALSVALALNLLVFAAAWLGRQAVADWLRYADHPEYVVIFAGLLCMDAVCAIPFAKLRAENRAWRFAGVKFAEILLTIALNLFFILGWRELEVYTPPEWPPLLHYQAQFGVAYIFLANLLASAAKFFWLAPELSGLRLPALPLLPPLLKYSLPMVITGLAGAVNETLSRAILKILLPYDTATNLKMLGIFGACYKLSVLMTLFVQAFRYAAEPFFFSLAGRGDAKRNYALVMQYFVLVGMGIFLFVSLFIDFFQYFIGPEFRAGLGVTPILLLANLCLGMYVNLSVWYKLSDRTGLGALTAVLGAGLTIGLNIWWIPRWGYVGSAWATLLCYAFMVCLSWLFSRFYYPVNYPLGKIAYYWLLGLGLYWADDYLIRQYGWQVWSAGGLCLAVYCLAALSLDIPKFLKSRRL